MSAKRRKTVLERFSVPLGDATASGTQPPGSHEEMTRDHPIRIPKASGCIAQDNNPVIDEADGDDSDFIVCPGDDDCSSFVNYEDDFSCKSQTKGKGKMSTLKGKGKAALVPSVSIKEVTELGESVNPKVSGVLLLIVMSLMSNLAGYAHLPEGRGTWS